jgi:hypothetical protein
MEHALNLFLEEDEEEEESVTDDASGHAATFSLSFWV